MPLKKEHTLNISDKSVITMHYLVKDMDDQLIDSSHDAEPIVFLQGSKYLVEGLEQALYDHQKGDKFEVQVTAEQAYGERHEQLVQTLGKEMFSGFEAEVGMQLRASTDQGEQTVIVIDKTDETITVDGNHPLAGIDLVFDVEIIDVRAATKDEIAHGHAHVEGGCGHTH